MPFEASIKAVEVVASYMRAHKAVEVIASYMRAHKAVEVIAGYMRANPEREVDQGTSHFFSKVEPMTRELKLMLELAETVKSWMGPSFMVEKGLEDPREIKNKMARLPEKVKHLLGCMPASPADEQRLAASGPSKPRSRCRSSRASWTRPNSSDFAFECRGCSSPRHLEESVPRMFESSSIRRISSGQSISARWHRGLQ